MRTGILPQIIDETKKHTVATSLLHNLLNSSNLFGVARNGLAISLTGMRPASLQVIGHETGTDILEIFQLLSDEGAGGRSVDVGVEEGMDVGGDDVDDGAEGRRVFLEDVHRFRGRDGAGEAGGDEGGLGGGDEGGQFAHADVVVEDGLVADDDHFDHGPVARGPGGDGADLGLRAGDARRGDVDAQHEFEVVFLGGAADVLEPAAVGAVQADRGEALGGDDGDVRVHGFGAFAGAFGGVGRVGHAPLLAAADVVGAGGLSLGRGGGGRCGWGVFGSGRCGGSGFGGLSWGADMFWCRGGGCGLGRHERGGFSVAGSRVREWADEHLRGRGDGDGRLWLSVGAGCVGSRGGVNHHGGLGDHGRGRCDGVGTARRADVGGCLDDAGRVGFIRLDGCVGADNGGGSLHDGGNTSVGLRFAVAGKSGGCRGRHGGFSCHGDCAGGNGVGSWRRADGHEGCGYVLGWCCRRAGRHDSNGRVLSGLKSRSRQRCGRSILNHYSSSVLAFSMRAASPSTLLPTLRC